MMISPETYYEFELKGKSVEDIQAEIDSLKEQIAELKYKMEDPDYIPEMICPSDDTVLYWTREYLAMAIKALKESGGKYEMDEEDKRAAEFQNNLPYLTRIEFNYGGFGPFDPIIIECDKEILKWSESLNLFPTFDAETPRTRTELLSKIRELHLEEWQTEYWPDKYGLHVLDGIQWELELEYSNGHEPWKAFGSNAYPFSFKGLMAMMGENDWPFEDDDDDDEPNEDDRN